MKLNDSQNQRLDELFANYNCDYMTYEEYIIARDLIVSEN